MFSFTFCQCKDLENQNCDTSARVCEKVTRCTSKEKMTCLTLLPHASILGPVPPFSVPPLVQQKPLSHAFHLKGTVFRDLLLQCQNRDLTLRHFTTSVVSCTQGDDGQKYWETIYKERLAETEKENSNIVESTSAREVPEKLNSEERKYSKLTHTDDSGQANMVDVGEKDVTMREARARGRIYLGPQAFALVQENKIKKGDVLTVAQLAGIMAAKKTAELIPLCHNIALTKVDVNCQLNEKEQAVDVDALVRCRGRTGVEMEALTAVSMATLTVYDMCKAVAMDMVISDVRLVMKTGGKREYREK